MIRSQSLPSQTLSPGPSISFTDHRTSPPNQDGPQPFVFSYRFLLHYVLMKTFCSADDTLRTLGVVLLDRAHRVLTIGVMILTVTGCAGTPIATTPVHDDALSSVFLENVSDTSYQAAHPLKLPEATVADLLRGLHTKEKTGMLLLLGKALKSTNLNDIRLFSEDEIALLAPPLTKALAQASPHQRVGFRVSSIPPLSQSQKDTQRKETTTGYLFADGLSLHFTLTRYRHWPGKPSASAQKEPRALPDTDGLRDREVTFLPEAAVRPDAYDRSSWIGKSQDKSVAIDYQLLTRILSAPAQSIPYPPAAAASSMGQPPQVIPNQPTAAGRQDADLQTFREELKAMQKKLDEQNAELQRLKAIPLKP